jgi:signal transduction histidine kinase
MRPVNGSFARADRTLARLDASLITLVVILSAMSPAVWLDVGFPGVSDARALDITINVSAVLIGAAVAILAWARWRDTGESVVLYQSSAFVALTLVNAFVVAIVIAGREVEFGLSPDGPGEAPVYLWTVTRFVAAYLLVVGAIRSLRRERPPIPAPLLLLAPAVILVAVGVMLFGREDVLPPIPSVSEFNPTQAAFRLTLASTVLGALQIMIFVGFIVAAILFRRLYVRSRLSSHAYLAAGLVIAAFSQLHFLLAPVVAIGVVTSTDALRLAFYGVLFLGIQAELGDDLRALRRANSELGRLREVDAANATLAERTRLAREIHDGLAQDLWFAKLKQGKLMQDRTLGDEGRETGREVLGAIESALAEARQAVMAMRVDPSAGSDLDEVLRPYVEDFADRFGVRAEYHAPDAIPPLSPRTQAEILRIVQEALNNVRKHADATLIRVVAVGDANSVRIEVTDNGRGFDPAKVPPERYGLRSMRERAELVGGTLEIRSRASDGTSVGVRVPTRARSAEVAAS